MNRVNILCVIIKRVLAVWADLGFHSGLSNIMVEYAEAKLIPLKEVPPLAIHPRFG